MVTFQSKKYRSQSIPVWFQEVEWNDIQKIITLNESLTRLSDNISENEDV